MYLSLIQRTFLLLRGFSFRFRRTHTALVRLNQHGQVLQQLRMLKIVMLAQGEFKEFLKADSDKKNEILGKLFDNSVYVRYRELLKGARELLRKEREAHRNAAADTMQNFFRLPEEAEQEDFLPEHPKLLEHLSMSPSQNSFSAPRFFR